MKIYGIGIFKERNNEGCTAYECCLSVPDVATTAANNRYQLFSTSPSTDDPMTHIKRYLNMTPKLLEPNKLYQQHLNNQHTKEYHNIIKIDGLIFAINSRHRIDACELKFLIPNIKNAYHQPNNRQALTKIIENPLGYIRHIVTIKLDKDHITPAEIHRDLDEIKDKMVDNIEKIVCNIEKAEDLVKTSDDLVVASKNFRDSATKLNTCRC